MPQVNSNESTEVAPHRFVTEASTLRLAPGDWPTSLTTNMGNGQPFIIRTRRTDGSAVYHQRFGCLSLHVLND